MILEVSVSDSQVPDGSPLDSHCRSCHRREEELIYLYTLKITNISPDDYTEVTTLESVLELLQSALPQQAEHVEIEKSGAEHILRTDTWTRAGHTWRTASGRRRELWSNICWWREIPGDGAFQPESRSELSSLCWNLKQNVSWKTELSSTNTTGDVKLSQVGAVV